MRSSCALFPFSLLALVLPALVLLAGSATAQEPTGIEIQGILSGGYTHSFQDTDLSGGGSFNDGNGIEIEAGFQAGDYLVFLAGYQWQGESDYDTHFIPLSLRMLSPPLLERVHLYGQFGLGLFFSQLHNEFNNPKDDNERGSAVRVGAGVEVEITEDVSGIVYGGYLWGLGSTDDYKYGTLGLGLQYRWDL
jgi:hypothetical protein